MESFIKNKNPFPTNASSIIYFYRQWEMPSGIFSNFFNHPIIYNCEEFKTTEHAFQAYKFKTTDLGHYHEIKNSNTPSIAARLGRLRYKPLRKDWEEIKDQLMFDICTVKFLNSEKLFRMLMSTGDSILFEDSPTDYYWGGGKDRSGKNMLGNILVKIREEIRFKMLGDDFENKRAEVLKSLEESGKNLLTMN